jgi:hypothetical protein
LYHRTVELTLAFDAPTCRWSMIFWKTDIHPRIKSESGLFRIMVCKCAANDQDPKFRLVRFRTLSRARAA